MRFLFLGAGAIGGYYGAQLLRAGADVRFLVRPGRARQIEQDGLRVQSRGEDWRQPVRPLLEGQVAAPFDVVVLTCKAYDLTPAIAAIAPAIGPHSVVLPLLNGLAHLDALDRHFGAQRVLGGVAYIATTLSADGIVCHLGPADTLLFGARDGAAGAVVAALAEAFAATPVVARASSDILQDLWEKWCMLAAGAALTCLMRGTIGEIMASEHGAALTAGMIAETRAVAAAFGHAPRPAAVEQARRILTDPASGWAASMMRDIQAGAPRLEADHILGDLIRRARQVQVATPLLEAAHCHLQIHAARNTAP